MIRPKNTAPLSVDEVTSRVKKILDLDPLLSQAAVEGEFSELKRHSSGHVYFTLAGRESLMPCVMFRSDAASMITWPQVGDRVVVLGRVALYAQRSTVQIYARKMVPLGMGAAARAKEELKRRFEAQGIFAPERKRPLPEYPQKVACLTSPTGAAVQDVCSLWRKRFPAAELIIVPCVVQGIQAVPSIIEALQKAALISDLDVAMLVRGGGGRDDLNPFDDEELVLEISRCRVPLVSGVGHQVDWTLCDLAADFRAPTPSAAAELIFPDQRAICQKLVQDRGRLKNAVQRHCLQAENFLEQAQRTMIYDLQNAFDSQSQKLKNLEKNLSGLCLNALNRQNLRLLGIERTLRTLSPSALAERGYIRCVCGQKAAVSAAVFSPGDLLTAQFLDGDVECRVEGCRLRSQIG